MSNVRITQMKFSLETCVAPGSGSFTNNRLPGVGNGPRCARCEKSGSECVRSRRMLRFRHAISSTPGLL